MISARVMSSVMTFSATEAPTPVLEPPAFASALAFAVSLRKFCAATVTSPVPKSTRALPGIHASVWSIAMLRAKAPATPTSCDPAPAFAMAEKSCRVSAPTGVMSALAVKPLPRTTVRSPRNAWLTRCT